MRSCWSNQEKMELRFLQMTSLTTWSSKDRRMAESLGHLLQMAMIHVPMPNGFSSSIVRLLARCQEARVSPACFDLESLTCTTSWQRVTSSQSDSDYTVIRCSWAGVGPSTTFAFR